MENERIRIPLKDIEVEREKLSNALSSALNDFKKNTGYKHPEDVRLLINLTHKDEPDHNVIVFFNQEKYYVSNVDPDDLESNLVNGVPGNPHEYAAAVQRKEEEEKLKSILKLPTEVQEIIHYYTCGKHKPYGNHLDNFMSAIVGLSTELSPFLDNKFLHVEEGKNIHGLNHHEYRLLGLSMHKNRIRDLKDAQSSHDHLKV